MIFRDQYFPGNRFIPNQIFEVREMEEEFVK